MIKNMTYSKVVPLYNILEIVCKGKADGNPFVDYDIYASITGADNAIVKGFYDGDGIYKVRFMPQKKGEYAFQVYGSFSNETAEGAFVVENAAKGNHGMVSVANQYHFAYADGTPYYSVGTTCYVWHLQGEEKKQETLENLVKSGFNKIRFCVFPKHYAYNLSEPPCYPFEGMPMDSRVLTMENFNDYNGCPEGNNWDFRRFQPQYFRNIEDCIEKLRDRGIEADMILFHPYDRWGFSMLTREQSKLYLEYVAARFSAYSNVWWSFANEYDLMPNRTADDWHFYAKVKMVRRFWETVCRGGYAGHGETYLHDTSDIWWSHGGTLYGESCDRMKFLHKIMLETPSHGLKVGNGLWDEVMAVSMR